MKIAVDAMGGDHAPGVVVDGAVQAARDLGVELILVGRHDIIEAELAKVDWTEIRDLVERTGNTFVNDDQDRDWKREGF